MLNVKAVIWFHSRKRMNFVNFVMSLLKQLNLFVPESVVKTFSVDCVCHLTPICQNQGMTFREELATPTSVLMLQCAS